MPDYRPAWANGVNLEDDVIAPPDVAIERATNLLQDLSHSREIWARVKKSIERLRNDRQDVERGIFELRDSEALHSYCEKFSQSIYAARKNIRLEQRYLAALWHQNEQFKAKVIRDLEDIRILFASAQMYEQIISQTQALLDLNDKALRQRSILLEKLERIFSIVLRPKWNLLFRRSTMQIDLQKAFGDFMDCKKSLGASDAKLSKLIELFEQSRLSLRFCVDEPLSHEIKQELNGIAGTISEKQAA